MSRQCILRILRGTPHHQYWEEFSVHVKQFYNVTGALMDIQQNPINRQGERVTPVAWEQGCLEEVCGACSMLIDGRPRQACSAMLERVMEQTHRSVIAIAPLTKFPLVRDLVVDRSKMFDDLIKVRAWVDLPYPSSQKFGPPVDPAVQHNRYLLSTCMSCGCCSEACPEVHPNSQFIGPAPISQVQLFNTDACGKREAPERLRALMQPGGIATCGNAQNCARVCPKQIPLTESIAILGRKVTGQAIRDLFFCPKRDKL